jgi:type I restriction enzyme S subunit
MRRTPFGDIRDEWEIVPLPEVVFFQEGPGLRKWQWTKSGMKVINGRNVLADGRIDLGNTERFISLDEFQDRYSHFAIELDDIVVTTSGTLGKVGRISSDHLPLMMNTSVIRFHPLEQDSINQDYLHAFLRSELFMNQARSMATGTAQLNFGPSHLKQMQIPLPGLREQKAIGSIVRSFDDLIANNNRRIEVLEEIARAIYREWFVEFKYPGHEDVRLVGSELGPIPVGWMLSPLGDRLDVLESGGRPRGGAVLSGVPSIGAENVRGLGKYDYSSEKYIPEDYFQSMNRGRVQTGDVLLYKDGAYIGRMSMTGAQYPHKKAAINEHVFRLRSDRWLGQEYLYFCLSSVEVNHRIVDLNSNAAQPGISQAKLKGLNVLVPPRDVTVRFTELVGPMLDLIFTLAHKSRLLSTTRDLLLPKLISGEIDVSNLENGDTA